MAYNTGNPLGSTDPRDLRDNSENIDVMLNSTTETSHPDRIGTSRKTWHGMEVEHDAQIVAHEAEFQDRIAGMSFTRVGTFSTGYTLTDARQVLLYETDGHEYGWTGAFPKVVPPASTPAGTGGIGAGAWVDRTDVTLRSELEYGLFDTPLDYISFGAVPDNNLFDNYASIKACHEFANSIGARVKPSPGIYNIGALPDSIGIKVNTDTDWSSCKFRLSSETSSDTDYGTRRLFSCESEKIDTIYQADVELSDFTEGAMSLPSVLSLGYRNVVLAVYSNDTLVIRNGVTPVPKREIVVMFEGGLISSPLSFSYSTISSIDIYPIETSRLQLKNLQFIFDGFKSAVGLYLQRNNTELLGISVDEVDRSDNGYTRNFIEIYNNYNTIVSGGVGSSFVTNGSYNFRPEMTDSCIFDGIKGNGSAGGVFGGNYNKNIKYFDCDVSRIDQHALGEDCIIDRCTIYDNFGISVTGKGRLSINDARHYTKSAVANLVTLRSDYNTTWDGTISISGVKIYASTSGPSEFSYNIVDASVIGVDFGVDCKLPNVLIRDVGVKTDDTFNCMVTAYNLPNNSGVNNQHMPSIVSFCEAESKQLKVRFRATPPIKADNARYQGAGTHINVSCVNNPYSWVYSGNYNIEKDSIVYFDGVDYSSGTPFKFTASIDNCNNVGFVWTIPSEIRVINCNRVAAAITKVNNVTGDNFPGIHRSVWVSNSSFELMNYRTSQEFMLEQINARDCRIIKPNINTVTGSYRSFDSTNAISYDGVVMDSDAPIISGQEYMINNMMNGWVNSSYWRTTPPGRYITQSLRFIGADTNWTTTIAIPAGYFSSAPVAVSITPIDINKPSSIQYNYSSSTATSVSFTIYTTDGSNFTSGNYNFSCVFLS